MAGRGQEEPAHSPRFSSVRVSCSHHLNLVLLLLPCVLRKKSSIRELLDNRKVADIIVS